MKKKSKGHEKAQGWALPAWIPKETSPARKEVAKCRDSTQKIK